MQNLPMAKVLPVVGRFLGVCCCSGKFNKKMEAQKKLILERRRKTLQALVSECKKLKYSRMRQPKT
jgi:hypothetical protein